MATYEKCKVEAQHDHTSFKVLVKGWFGIWKSGYVHTNYFGISYETEKAALNAIEKYKARFTEAQCGELSRP